MVWFENKVIRVFKTFADSASTRGKTVTFQSEPWSQKQLCHLKTKESLSDRISLNLNFYLNNIY